MITITINATIAALIQSFIFQSDHSFKCAQRSFSKFIQTSFLIFGLYYFTPLNGTFLICMLLVCPLGPAPLFFLTTKGEKVTAASDATIEFGKRFLLGTLVIFVFPSHDRGGGVGEAINGLKKRGLKNGGLAGRLAQRGYGKARS